MLFIDPNRNLWATNDAGRIYSFEVCDPVEAPTYAVNGVSVSNFVTPAWFDPLSVAKEEQRAQRDEETRTTHGLAVETTTYDKLGLLEAPFTILKGGYAVYASEGKEHQVFGDEFPEWRKQMKTGSMSGTSLRRAEARSLETGPAR